MTATENTNRVTADFIAPNGHHVVAVSWYGKQAIVKTTQRGTTTIHLSGDRVTEAENTNLFHGILDVVHKENLAKVAAQVPNGGVPAIADTASQAQAAREKADKTGTELIEALASVLPVLDRKVAYRLDGLLAQLRADEYTAGYAAGRVVNARVDGSARH